MDLIFLWEKNVNVSSHRVVPSSDKSANKLSKLNYLAVKKFSGVDSLYIACKLIMQNTHTPQTCSSSSTDKDTKTQWSHYRRTHIKPTVLFLMEIFAKKMEVNMTISTDINLHLFFACWNASAPLSNGIVCGSIPFQCSLYICCVVWLNGYCKLEWIEKRQRERESSDQAIRFGLVFFDFTYVFIFSWASVSDTYA